MGFWDALSGTMRTIRRRRIGPREAERLLTVERVGSEHVELTFLLNAATAPPRPHELLNHEPAVAAFEQAGPFHRAGRGSGTGPVSTGPGRARRRRITRSVAIKAIAGATAILIGGTAYAAETGRLPDAAQRQAHGLFSSVGVPAPGGAAPVGGSPTATQTPTSTATPGGVGRTPGPTEPGLLGLCRAWRAVQEKPNGKPMAAGSFRNLAEAAGGESRIPTFCAPLLAERPGRAPALPAPAGGPSATPEPDAGNPAPGHPGGGQAPGRPTSLPNREG